MIIFPTFPQQQVMAPQTVQPVGIGAKSSRTTGASTNAPPGERLQRSRHQLVHRDAAIAATDNMTQDSHSKTVGKPGSSMNMKQHAIGCESMHLNVAVGPLERWHTAGVRTELRDKFIAASNGKPPWSTKASIRTVRKLNITRL